MPGENIYFYLLNGNLLLSLLFLTKLNVSIKFNNKTLNMNMSSFIIYFVKVTTTMQEEHSISFLKVSLHDKLYSVLNN